MEIYVLRHGTTEWNRVRRLQGCHDIALSEEGISLAEKTGRAVLSVPFDICFTSPLSRAETTARLVLCGRDIPVIRDERLREISFGVLEGTRILPKEETDPEDPLRLFFEHPERYPRPEGGEDLYDVIRRTGEFWKELTGNKKLQDKTVLVSTHGCASRALLQSVEGSIEDYWKGHVPPNCSMTHIHADKAGARIMELDMVF